MKVLTYAIALPLTLASYGACALDSLTPREASDRCYAGDRAACAVVQQYEQNERKYSSPYEPDYAPRAWGPAEQWVPRDFSAVPTVRSGSRPPDRGS
jgi:hypothetical protein